LVQPDQPIKYFATRIHGLTDQDVSAAPRFAAIKDEVLAAVDADALVAHNAHVDISVLSRKLGDWKTPEVFDTLKLARRLLPDVGSYRLGALVEKFKLAETTTGHALACLYAADRYHHLEAEVRPNTNAGRVVISDRYIPSALVMQRFDGIDPAFLWQLNASAQPLSALTR
jgi:DNA polymerase III epsilon subunit-like protein